LARGVLLYRRKSIPYEKDDSLYAGYAVDHLPADFFDSVVYRPEIKAVWSCGQAAFFKLQHTRFKVQVLKFGTHD
jgi:hypothetical protein